MKRNINADKHGHASRMFGKSPTYRSWQCMLQRCFNPSDPRYYIYGGRGITVCDHWCWFEDFLADMGERPEGKSLDRKDTNGNYEPDNCRWATRSEQQRNRRDSIKYTYLGESLTLQEWSERTGLSYHAIRARYRHGWPPELALTLQVTKRNSCVRRGSRRTDVAYDGRHDGK